MVFVFSVIAVLGGVLNTIAAGSNSALNRGLGQPVIAALTIAVVSAMLYISIAPFVGISWPKASAIVEMPWWGWIGGLLGGFYVLASIFFAEKLGAAIFVGLSVSAAIVTSVALDHFGLVGFKQHSAGLWRVMGCIFMIGGLALVTAF